MPHTLMWEFRVSADKRAAFERVYATDGDWAKLFARADGFLGTQLLADTETPGRYLTIDRWTTPEAFDAFKVAFAAEYTALDTQCEGLTETEARIGSFSD